MTGTPVRPQESTARQPRHGHANRNNKRRNKPNNWEARNGKSRRFRSGQQKSLPAMPAKLLCSVCKKVEGPKYKCPKCRDTYCSIQCCREHKAKGCNRSKQNAATATTSRYLPKGEINFQPAALDTQNDNAPRSDPPPPSIRESDDELEEGWKITDTMKEALRKSDWLKKELQDVGLRQIITKITSAPNVTRRNQSKTKREDFLDLAKENAPFKQFLDKVLVLTGVMGRQGTDANTDLEKWLKQEMCSGSNRQLTLTEQQGTNFPAKKLVDSKSGEKIQNKYDSESSSNDEESESESSSDDTTSEESDASSDEDS